MVTLGSPEFSTKAGQHTCQTTNIGIGLASILAAQGLNHTCDHMACQQPGNTQVKPPITAYGLPETWQHKAQTTPRYPIHTYIHTYIHCQKRLLAAPSTETCRHNLRQKGRAKAHQHALHPGPHFTEAYTHTHIGIKHHHHTLLETHMVQPLYGHTYFLVTFFSSHGSVISNHCCLRTNLNMPGCRAHWSLSLLSSPTVALVALTRLLGLQCIW